MKRFPPPPPPPPPAPSQPPVDLSFCAALRVEDFLRWAGISRFLFYQEVKRGRIRPKKCGARTMIPLAEAERWLSELPDALPVIEALSPSK